jgi:hypothetical protein
MLMRVQCDGGRIRPDVAGGTGFPQFVAAHPAFSSTLIAGVTLYLGVAYLTGTTARAPCAVGSVFAVALPTHQFASALVTPRGTDVGPMPIHVATYVALFLAENLGRD